MSRIPVTGPVGDKFLISSIFTWASQRRALAGGIAAVTLAAILSFPYWPQTPALAGTLVLALVLLALHAGQQHSTAAGSGKTEATASGKDDEDAAACSRGEPKVPPETTASAPVQNAAFDLHAVLGDCLHECRTLMGGKLLRLLLRVDPDVPYQVSGDARRLRAALRLLTAHAVTLTRQGYVAIEAHRPATAATPHWIRFEVRDTADPAARATGSGGDPGPAVAALVESIGGKSGTASPTDRCNVAWFEIPLPHDPAAVGEPVTGTRVLVVTTDQVLFPALLEALTHLGTEVVRAGDDTEAVAELTCAVRNGKPFHAIFADAACAVGTDGEHRLDNLADKAVRVHAPLILLNDAELPEETLRNWGYGTVLPRVPVQGDLFSCIHASPLRQFATDTRVRHIEPWAWTNTRALRKRVLIVDDNRTTLMIHAAMLERADFEVETESDPLRALERLLSGGYRAAIVDMRMPLMNGVELVRRYRMRRPHSRLPIVILTVNSGVAAQNECADAGADAFLTKPVRTQQLLDTVQRLLQTSGVTHLASTRTGPDEAGNENTPVLDEAVLAELDRLYRTPEAMTALVDSFELEGRDLLGQVDAAVRMHQHGAFVDYMNSLKGSGLNVGALQLIGVCRAAENTEFLEFHHAGAEIALRTRHVFEDTLAALRQRPRDGVAPGPDNHRSA